MKYVSKWYLVWPQGKDLGSQPVPVWVGLLNSERWGSDDVSVVEWGADGVERHGLNQTQQSKESKANL